jgi:hypothetical protein
MSKKKNGTASRSSRNKMLGQFPIKSLEDDNGELPSWSHRIAFFLHWWAQKMPYDFIGYNEILKAVEKRSSLPRLDTKDVWALRDRLYGAKTVLRRDYKRDTVHLRGMGVRATVDDKDVLLNVAPRQTKVVERSIKRMADVDSMIDLKKVPDSPETRPFKNWYNRSVRGILKQIAAPEFTERLLPPKPDDE